MINQNTSVFFLHNFALKSSLAAKVEIVKALRVEMRDYFGKINEFKSKYNPSHIRRMIRNLYRLQRNGHRGAELAEKLWPAIEAYLNSEIDVSADKSEFEKKAYLIIILERANKFINFDFLPRDTSFQIYLFRSLFMDYVNSLIGNLFSESLTDSDSVSSFMLNRLSYSLNLSIFLHMDPETETGVLQDLGSELRLFVPVKKLKPSKSALKHLAILFDDVVGQVQERLGDSLFRANEFSFTGKFKTKALFNDLLLSFEAAMLLADKYNKDLEKYNNNISDLKYEMKDLALKAKSKRLYQIYFDDNDLLSRALKETVKEMAEEAGVNLNNMEKEMLKARAKSKDFYRTVNSLLVCSCSYFDTELIKSRFFNNTADFLRVNLPEIDCLSASERETIGLAALTSMEGGLDFLLSAFSDADSRNQLAKSFDLKELLSMPEKQYDSMDFYSHNIKFALWQRAKQIIARIKVDVEKIEILRNNFSDSSLEPRVNLSLSYNHVTL